MVYAVMFSGGVGSWAAARRIRETIPASRVKLIFADTLMEDEDLYRFLKEARDNLGCEMISLTEGRDPWQVFFDVRYLGNSRIDPCSRILKRQLIRKYVDDNLDPKTTEIVLGIDWTEIHRFDRAKPFWEPFKLTAPMCEKPYLMKNQMLDWLRSEGIEPPRLYKMGFPHNNCGGFCIKAGIGHFKKLLAEMPERYAYHEQKEQDLREYLGKDVAILKDRRNGGYRPLTLKELRTRELDEEEMLDFGGCGCFSPMVE